MGKTYYSPWQNPTYPQDQDMPVEEMERLARAASLARAQSPGPRTCLIDGAWSVDEPGHTERFSACMEYRHRNVIGDAEPWTYWQLIDGPLIGPKPPAPTIPVGLIGWQVRAAAGEVPAGAEVPTIPPPQPGSQPRVWAVRSNTLAENVREVGWQGYTVAHYIDPSVVWPLQSAFATRVSFVGSFTIRSAYIGTADPNDTWFATNMHQLTFNNGEESADVIMADNGDFIPLVSDPMPLGFDGTSGFWITFFVAINGNGTLPSSTQPGWGIYYAFEDIASGVDFYNPYTYYTNNALGLLTIEGLYDTTQLTPRPE